MTFRFQKLCPSCENLIWYNELELGVFGRVDRCKFEIGILADFLVDLSTSIWFDKWCVASPLSNIISSRDIARAGFNHASKNGVVEMVWVNLYRCIMYGIRFVLGIIWFHGVIWCGSMLVFRGTRSICAGPSLASIITHLMPIAKRKSSKSCIGKLVVAAAAYFVWHECNSRLFNKVKLSVTEVVDCILSTVRLKLLSCRFKKSRDAILFAPPQVVFRCVVVILGVLHAQVNELCGYVLWKPSRDFTRPLGPSSGLKGLLHTLNATVIPTKLYRIKKSPVMVDVARGSRLRAWLNIVSSSY
nr:RNA-directed DNA polymerase, eukaryota, reverse transcriptase zinc-binding domain protein [Tanacetum cinerariifolium]